MKTKIIWLAILISYCGISVFGQETVLEKVNPKKYYAEGNLGVNFIGDQKNSSSSVDIKATLGYQIRHNLSYGLSLCFANYNNSYNPVVHYVYLGDPLDGYKTYTINNKDGYSLGIKPFIRINKQLLNRLILNIDMGIGFDFANFSNNSVRTGLTNPSGDMDYKSKTNSGNIFLDFSFVIELHKSMGLTVGFQGAQIEVSKTVCENITGTQNDSDFDEIKTINVNLFKNLHEPYVGFIFYF